MCRNIHRLHNFTPPATDSEIRDAALQYVRKISGYQYPSAANRETFDAAVDAVATATVQMLEGLVTSAPPRTREDERAKAQARARARFG